MKDKNFLDDIENKSLEELNSLANKIIDNLQKKGQEDFIQGYQQLLKLNNYIDKKFHQETRSISKKSKSLNLGNFNATSSKSVLSSNCPSSLKEPVLAPK